MPVQFPSFRSHLGLLAALMLAPAAVAAQSPSAHALRNAPADSSAVAETVHRFHAALAAGDSLAAMNLLTPGVVVLESGDVETRAEYRSHHLAADIEFARSVRSEQGPIKVRVAGNAAWASSTSSTQGEFRGRAINSAGAELMVLVRTPAGWRIDAIHWSSHTRR
jgi:ketosteroid isomerase-like protein